MPTIINKLKFNIMKKIYLMAIVFCAIGTSASAQFTDDMESYSQGPLFTDIWTTWDASDDDSKKIIVTSEQAFSGSQSGVIREGSADGSGPQDCVLNLEGVAPVGSGIWSLQWMMYIPSGNSGYFNIQGSVDPSANDNTEFMSGNITFNALNGNPGVGEDANANATGLFQFPHDEWFKVNIVCDTDNQTYQLNVADTEVPVVAWQPAAGTQPFATQFGGLDFFASDVNNTYYVDDIIFQQGIILGSNDFATDTFSVFPNPVKDVLNINSKVSVDTVVVYDILGKVVLTANPNSISPAINTSGLAAGAYLVKISGNGSTQTIKVLK